MKFWLLATYFSQLFGLLKLQQERRTFLIANGAEFIGYHTALKLAEANNVVVIDDFTIARSDLQNFRAEKMSKMKSISVYQGDICDTYLLTELFKRYQFHAVVYLPTHAETDTRLLELSTECIAHLLEIMKTYKDTRFVLLSSDIVYGDSSLPSPPVPSISIPPISMEAVLKLSSEKMVSTYCELYQLPVVILRLFGVYGPWSDSDSIMHNLMEQVYNEQDITLSVDSASERDFTYIDDAVEGILLSLDYTPQKCDEVYNIGTGKSTTMQSVIDMIANSLNKKANLGELFSRHNSHVVSTRADISLSMSVLKFHSKVTINEGISKYTKWFIENKHKTDSISSFMPDHEIEKAASRNHLKYKSEEYINRVRDLRQMYETYAEDHGYSISKLYRTKTFSKHTGVNLMGGNNQKITDLQELQYRCQMFDECMAYDTSGKIKGVLDPESTWRRMSGAVYVADVDVCKAGVHKCYGNASCVSTGKGQFKCVCPPGWKLYKDHDCVELYKNGRKSAAEKVEEITDKIDGLDWNTFAQSKEFYPFRGKRVANEFLSYYPEAKDKIAVLKEACIQSYHCMGFTSDGILMSNVDVRKWIDDSSVTLYARDVDYCSIDEVLCRPGQRCRRVAPGKYACV